MSSDSPAAQAAFPMRVSCRCRSSGSDGRRAAPSANRLFALSACSAQSSIAAEVSSRRAGASRGGLRRRRPDGVRPRCSGRAVRADARGRHGGQGGARAAPPQLATPSRADRRRRVRRDGAGRRPGTDARARRRAARRPPHVGSGIRCRPHVRRSTDGDDGRRGRDRDESRRRRARGRRRAHGPSPDGRRRRLQPPLRRRAHRRRVRRGHGQDRREPARRLPAPHEGARGRVRVSTPSRRAGGRMGRTA